ncbi:hypothetical protein BCON_0167g00130 [Botryotinia convoluta]|uniref:Uncharacterized protein n=1 Tax=Botryotinia convoluta TaxID=54673 RepID=A0A4Z1HXB6_9HELO|nr:hypothetical protein BCON_0167g00130 [Botryotinia convoluta]
MGKGKKMAGSANKEPLGSRTKNPTYNSSPLKQEKNDEDLPHFRAEGSSYMFGSIKQEGDNDLPVIPALGPAPEALTATIVPFLEPVGIPVTIDRVPEAPKAPVSVMFVLKARTSPVSPAALFPLFRPKRSRSPHHRGQDTPNSPYYGQAPRRGSPTDEGASRGSYYRPSPHRDTPTDRGVLNSSYHRPSYSVRTTNMSSESKSRALSLASTYKFRESLDNEETLITESWTKLSSRKHGEFMVPAYSSPEPPSPIRES